MDVITSAPWQMWATLVIIAFAIAAYASDRFSLELISISIVAALLLLFEFAPLRDAGGQSIVTARDILQGYADPALAAVIGLLILTQGLFQAGTMELPTEYLLRAFHSRPFIVTGGSLLLVMVTSAFLNDTPVVVMFIPIIAAIASAGGVSPSRLMMPLSFIALFGGMTTLIGSSTNILAAGVFHALTDRQIGFFELTPLGVVIGLTGLVYLATAGRMLLPRRESPRDINRRENKQFIAQFEITRGHFLLGKQAVAGLFPDLPDITVRMVQRREEAILPPYDDFRFQVGDVVIIAATRSALTNLLRKRPEILDSALSEVPLEETELVGARAQLTMVEAIVAPGSRMIGRTIAQIGFHYQTNCVILGIERRSRMIRTGMSSIRLEAGDVLLILGPLDHVRALRADRDLVILEWSMTGLPAPRNAVSAGVIFLGVVAAAASGLLSITIAAICGVLVMLGFGILNIRQAGRAFDRRIYLLIGASLAMGMALERTGGAALIGGLMAPIAANFGPAALISAMFIASAITTNVLSNNATAVLLMPIAINAASIAGIDALPLALTVIYGANCPFATPIAYQTNLLVMTPGHYKFRDYAVVGGPLVIVIWIVYSFAAPIYFRLAHML